MESGSCSELLNCHKPSSILYDPTSPTTPCHGFTIGNGEGMFFFIEKRVMVENKLIYFFFSFDSSFFSLKQNKFIEEKKKSKVSFVVDSMFILFQLLTMELALRIKSYGGKQGYCFLPSFKSSFCYQLSQISVPKKNITVFSSYFNC